MPCKLHNCTSNELCHYCKRKANKPKGLKRTSIKKKPYEIPKESKKRAKQNREYSKDVRAWKAQNPICKARLRGCQNKTVDCHHQRGKEGERLLDKRYWLPVCRSCHTWITEHSKEAIELELSKSRLNK